MNKISLSVMLAICSTQAGSVTLAKDVEVKLQDKLLSIENETASLVADIRSSNECKLTSKTLDERIRTQLRQNGHSSLYETERFRLDYCKFKIDTLRTEQEAKKERVISESIYSLPLGPERTKIRNLALAHYAKISKALDEAESADICSAFSYFYTAKFNESTTSTIKPLGSRFDGAYYHCSFNISMQSNDGSKDVGIQIKYNKIEHTARELAGNTEVEISNLATKQFVTRVIDRGFVNKTVVMKTYSY